MVLQSQLFRGDSKLESAAVSDPAHIVQGARGDHVRKIQLALNQVDGAGITADSSYGPGTAAAVSAFKKKRNILNFQGKIDNIVGKKTMAALDAEMLGKERGGGAGGGGSVARLGFKVVGDGTPPPLQSALVVVPFNEPPNTFILAQSVDSLNGPKGDKNDLDNAFPPGKALTSQEKQITDDFEAGLPPASNSGGLLSPTPLQTLERRATAEAFISNQSDGTDLMDTFFSNTDPPNLTTLKRTFNVGTSISNRVRDSRGFATEHDGVQEDIRVALQAQFLTGTINYKLMRGIGPQSKPLVLLANPIGVKDPPAVGFGLLEFRLLALIGSFQACKLIMNSFDVDTQALTYKAKLRYEFIDHFGVDNSDVINDGKGHGTDGQIAFWLLQHKFRPGHNPYRFQVIVEKEITGGLLDRNLFPL